MRIKLEIDSTKISHDDKQVDYQQFDGKSIDGNWHYAFATFALTIVIATPQISSWVESQPLIKSFQNLIGATNTTITNTTDLSNGQIAFPAAKGTPITSGFGWRIHPITGGRRFHTGIDFGAAMGTPIYAIANGRVEFAGQRGGYGNAVIVNHGGGKSTLYGHASKLYVKEGQQVVRGQMVAAVGSTGMSTAPHLHFEIRVNDKPINPRPYLLQYLAGR
jgi:murein DD-endopeptidase MepM/ murein hydrolase activator NlpD